MMLGARAPSREVASDSEHEVPSAFYQGRILLEKCPVKKTMSKSTLKIGQNNELPIGQSLITGKFLLYAGAGPAHILKTLALSCRTNGIS